MPSKEARKKWDAEHYTKLTIAVDKALAGEFKAVCGKEGASVAGAIKPFMRERCGRTESLAAASPPQPFAGRDRRRKRVKAIIDELERIYDAEESYAERIPENMQGGLRAEAAARSISAVSDAIDALSDAY